MVLEKCFKFQCLFKRAKNLFKTLKNVFFEVEGPVFNLKWLIFIPRGVQKGSQKGSFSRFFLAVGFWQAFLGENCAFLFVFVAFCPYLKSSRHAGESVCFAILFGTSSGAAAAPKKLQKKSQK